MAQPADDDATASIRRVVVRRQRIVAVLALVDVDDGIVVVIEVVGGDVECLGRGVERERDPVGVLKGRYYGDLQPLHCAVVDQVTPGREVRCDRPRAARR